MPIRTRVPGAHTVFSFLAAAAAARRLGMEWKEIREAMESVQLVARQQVLHGPQNMLIIDDSYNAAPMSMNAALDLLRASSGTKIAVLGDMLELGAQQEEAAHRSVGERVAEVADWLIVRGPRSQWLAQAAQRKGLPRSHVVRAENNAEAVAAVQEIVSGGGHRGEVADRPTMQRASAGVKREQSGARWSVLVKGSRGMRMEEVVQGLRGET